MNATASTATVQGRFARALDRRLSPHGAKTELAALRNERPLPPREIPDDAAHRDLERLTEPFRHGRARHHDNEARDAKREYRAAVAEWDPDDEESTVIARYDAVAAENRHKWHAGRAGGQRERFERVRSCGTRVMIAMCKTCSHDRAPVPEGCGIRRVCDRCDVQGAIARRARFGRARGRAMLAALRYGLKIRNRGGGAYSEKMLTLTLPHRSLADASGLVRELAKTDVEARIVALFLAWPKLLKKINRHWKDRLEFETTYHRAFEWKIARDPKDQAGHPHFHIYMHSPWIDVKLIREWWAEALRAVGWPVAIDAQGRNVISVDLRRLREWNGAAVRELLKGGREAALTLSRVTFAEGPGVDAFKYADGWTLGDILDFCSPRVSADLYCALEGRRLTQASRGFFIGDEPPTCAGCHGCGFLVRFEPRLDADAEAAHVEAQLRTYQERGPPS